MMKVFLKFLVFVMALLRLIGITGTYTILDESHTDYEGVYITIESIENGKNSHEIKVVWHNETENYISFGLGYTIEYLYGEQWVDVQIDDFAIPEIACSLEPHL